MGRALPGDITQKPVKFDAIRRGQATGRQVIQQAREAGAKKVYMAVAAPPVKFPNVYGIDMPAAEELIAHGKSVDEIQQEIGADWLIYQDLDDLIECVSEANPAIKSFDCSVFTGEYITGDIDKRYLDCLQAKRNDLAKKKQDQLDELVSNENEDGDLIDLHVV